MNITDSVIYLAKCAVNETIPDKEILGSLDLDAVFQEASRHAITVMVGMALQSAGVSDSAFMQGIAMAQRKTVILNHEMSLIFAELDKAGIWHMALKGAILKDWYPKFGMRESADVDVLFDSSRASDVRVIMNELGYETKEYDHGNHDIYYKPPVSNIEMHRDLFGAWVDKKIYDYYRDVGSRLKADGPFKYEFTLDDFYIYIITHEYVHYMKAGTGIRSLIDTYVMLKKWENKIDFDYVEEETDKLGISEFEKMNRKLSKVIFDNSFTAVPTDTKMEMFDFIVSSGSYGTLEHSIKKSIERNGGRARGMIKHIFKRLYLPMRVIKQYYPTFYKYKILIPILPFYRLIRSVGTERLHKEMRIMCGKKE